MNPYIIPTSCAICGGEGVASIQQYNFSDPWTRQFTHQDPSVCISILKQKENEKAKTTDNKETSN